MVVREPSVELLRQAAGTRIEGIVQPQPPQTTQADAARAAVQTLQAGQDAARAAQQASQQPAQPAPTVVRTPVGDIALRTPIPFPEGGRIGFEIAQTTPNQVTLRIADLNGQPIQQALTQLAAERAADRATAPPRLGPNAHQPGALPSAVTTLTPGQVWTPNGAVPLTQAGTLNAFVLAGSALPTAAQGGPAAPVGTPGGLQNALLTGSDLTIRVTSVTLAQPGAAAPQGVTPGVLTAGTVAPGTAAAAGTTATAAPASAATASPPGTASQSPTASGPASPALTTTNVPQGANALLPAGGAAQSGLRVVSAQGWPPAPFTTPTQVQATPVQLALTGVVTAQSTAAQVLVQTDAGTLQLGSRVNLPPGTTVTLEVLTQTQPRVDASGAPIAGAPPPSPAAALPFAGTMAWPALTEALQLLQRTDPQAAQMLANTLPDGGPRTVVAALSFVQAMRSGDLRQWPGDNNLRALERAGPRGTHLARTLSGEVAQMSAQSRETAGEWRATPIPWNANGQVEKINLITRREEGPDEDEKAQAHGKGQGLRFLLDLELSRLGALQLDGMVREESKNFDMMIRSHQPLEDEIRRDLSGLFVMANESVGLKGTLTFQVTKKFADPIGSAEPLKLERDGVWA